MKTHEKIMEKSKNLANGMTALSKIWHENLYRPYSTDQLEAILNEIDQIMTHMERLKVLLKGGHPDGKKST